MSMSFLHDELKEVSTHKKEFLERIERIMPWGEMEKLIRPYYYEGKYGNKPYDLELMIRIHLLQNLYDLSDMGARNEVIDSRAFSDFCRVESSNQIPDGDTIGKFRNLLIQNGIHEKFFAMVVRNLTDRGLILKKGTIVDSTIISAPTSTKNKEKKRDPDAHSVKKGTTWYFGYRAHIGVDKDTGLVHHVKVTAAKKGMLNDAIAQMIINKLRGLASDETLLSQLSFIDNAQVEMEKRAEENKFEIGGYFNETEGKPNFREEEGVRKIV